MAYAPYRMLPHSHLHILRCFNWQELTNIMKKCCYYRFFICALEFVSLIREEEEEGGAGYQISRRSWRIGDSAPAGLCSRQCSRLFRALLGAGLDRLLLLRDPCCGKGESRDDIEWFDIKSGLVEWWMA